MDKEKVLQIFKETESLTAVERAFLGKKLIKSIVRDLQYKDELILRLTKELDYAEKSIERLENRVTQLCNQLPPIEFAIYDDNKREPLPKTITDEHLKDIEKFKEMALSSIEKNETKETELKTKPSRGTITAKTAFKNLNKPPQ